MHTLKTYRLLSTIFFSGLIFFFSCENDINEVNELSKQQYVADTARNVDAVLSNTGKLRARLRTKLLLRITSDTMRYYLPDSVHIDFYNDSTKQVEATVKTLTATYYEELNKAFLKDSVLVYNTKGDTLRTEELWWDQNKEKFYTDKFVRIRTPDKIIFGYGLEAAQDFSWQTVLKPTGVVAVKDAGIY